MSTTSFIKLIIDAKILDYSEVKGSYFFLPHGLKIKNRIFSVLESFLVKSNHIKIEIPTFLKYKTFLKEPITKNKFENELFTFNGLVLKPTSQMVLYPFLKKYLKSWKQLPLKVYTTNRVYRREKQTRPLIRCSEIMFFNESHSFFKDEKSALENISEIIALYSKIFNYFNLQYYIFKRPKEDSFPGAEITYGFDYITDDYKRLQIGTVHYLKTNFSEPLDLKFKTFNNKFNYIYQTCYGISERLIYAVLETRRSEKYLRIPFKIAPLQFIIKENYSLKNVTNLDKELYYNNLLEFFKVNNYRYGFEGKTLFENNTGIDFFKKGIPFRITVGSNEIKLNSVSVFSRSSETEKLVELKALEKYINAELDEEYDSIILKNSLKKNITFFDYSLTSDEFKKDDSSKYKGIIVSEKQYDKFKNIINSSLFKPGLKLLGTSLKDGKLYLLASF